MEVFQLLLTTNISHNITLRASNPFSPTIHNNQIVTEFMEGGDLETLLADKKIELSFFQRMKIASDIALAMNWLHNTKPVFIHRDLKV